MNFDEWMLKNLAEDVEEAEALLWLTLAEDQDDPQILLALVQRIVRARGGIDDLGLSLEKKAALASALSRGLAAAQLPQGSLKACRIENSFCAASKNSNPLQNPAPPQHQRGPAALSPHEHRL